MKFTALLGLALSSAGLFACGDSSTNSPSNGGGNTTPSGMSLDGVAFPTPILGGGFEAKHPLSTVDSIPLLTAGFFGGEGTVKLTGDIVVASPKVGSFSLEASSSVAQHNTVTLERARPGLDTCSYSSKSGTVQIDAWTTTTTTQGKPAHLVSGSVNAVMSRDLLETGICPDLPLKLSFQEVLITDR